VPETRSHRDRDQHNADRYQRHRIGWGCSNQQTLQEPAHPERSRQPQNQANRELNHPALRGVNYFCRLATTISAGEGLANESAGDRGGLG
jgi:hypothetical protein